MTTAHIKAQFIEPMQCLAVKQLPEGEGWEYELKLDGYRTLAVKHGGRLTLFSRNRKSFNARFPGIAAALDHLPDASIVDGEIVAMDESGRPSFSRLQNFSKKRSRDHVLCLRSAYVEGEDLRPQPLETRRELIENVGSEDAEMTLSYSSGDREYVAE